jgi:AP-3 complex subunit delta
MFEKTLTDIVKGIRASKRDTALFISQCIAEIKQEINSTDLYVKANALNKLTFLQSMGYSMSWASFASIEVMSSPRFAHKRIGYLAACQGFNQNTDVILLTTNLLQKELRGAVGGSGLYEAGLAINCISNIVTEDLAKDVLPEVTSLTKHPHPYLRKKAILCLFKLFMKYPQGLRLTFDNIQQCLEDSDSSVVSCAVNVITELSDKNPKNYLHLAPAFFQLLTQSQNNWMLIKVVKLLGSLVPEEPRLARKLLEPLSKIVESTHAKSLLYEAVYAMTLCLPYCRKADGSMPAIVPRVVQLCGSTLKDFCADKDQNLKYLGLVGFATLRISHPKCLAESDARPLILACLSDDDVTIRTRALDLLPGMASRKNLQELIAQLLKHVDAASGQYKKDLVLKILELCSADKYALLQDFAWYLDILFELSYISPEDMGKLLEKQIIDVALRVLPVRAYAVKKCSDAIIKKRDTMMLQHVLPATAWIVGEYSFLLEGNFSSIIKSLTTPSIVSKLPSLTQSIYIQASLKVFAAATDGKANREELVLCLETLSKHLPSFLNSLEVEVKERAFTGIEILRALKLLPIALADSSTSQQVISDGINLLDLNDGSNKLQQKKYNSPLLSNPFSAAAPSINCIFKPEPMKPISVKSQRKKRGAPSGGIDVAWLDCPVDMSVFASLGGGLDTTKVLMEEVTFTKGKSSISSRTTRSGVDSQSAVGAMTTKFNDTREDIDVERSSLNQSKHQQDPFYLDSGGTVVHATSDVNKFGSIQLIDSDEEGDLRATKRKKKERKKVKHIQTTKSQGNSSQVLACESDEDDNLVMTHNRSQKARISKDFAGLASVDLTTPLGDDEVMPKREHRQVPQRPSADKVIKKKAKKEDKPKKVKKNSSSTRSKDGDLLDLGGLSSVNDVSLDHFQSLTEKHAPLRAASESSIFGDLLSFGASNSAPPVSNNQSMQSQYSNIEGETMQKSFRKGKNNLWMKASLKISGDDSKHLDWNLVLVYYKVAMSDQKNEKFPTTLTLRVDNMTSEPLNNLTLTLKKYGKFDIGTVPTNSSIESSKLGPFFYSHRDAAMELRGNLSTSNGAKAPLKVTFPAALHLSPTMGLDMEVLSTELSSREFHCATVRVERCKVDTLNIKKALVNFFNASEIGNVGPLVGTLAAQSSLGAKVFFLVKVNDSTVKIDIKSSDENVCMALASDIKRLVL